RHLLPQCMGRIRFAVMQRFEKKFLAMNREGREGRTETLLGHVIDRLDRQSVSVTVRRHIFVTETVQLIFKEPLVDDRENWNGALCTAIILRKDAIDNRLEYLGL